MDTNEAYIIYSSTEKEIEIENSRIMEGVGTVHDPWDVQEALEKNNIPKKMIQGFVNAADEVSRDFYRLSGTMYVRFIQYFENDVRFTKKALGVSFVALYSSEGKVYKQKNIYYLIGPNGGYRIINFQPGFSRL